MSRERDYSREEYIFNLSTIEPSRSQVYVYAFCNSCWFPGKRIEIDRKHFPYYLYSLNLSGNMKIKNLNTADTISYASGTFNIAKIIPGRFIANVGKQQPLIRKFILVRRNPLHDMIVEKMFANITAVTLADVEPVKSIMNKICQELKGEKNVDNAYLSGLFFQLLHVLSGNLPHYDYPTCIQVALSYIHSSFEKQNLNRDEIADAAGVSVRTLSNLFPKHLGVPCFTYVIDLRLAKVCRLLAFSDLPIKAIAEQCGFATPNFLSRTFQKKHSMTPREYRKQHEFHY